MPPIVPAVYGLRSGFVSTVEVPGQEGHDHRLRFGQLHDQHRAEGGEPNDLSSQPFNVSGLMNGIAKPTLPGGDPTRWPSSPKRLWRRSTARESDAYVCVPQQHQQGDQSRRLDSNRTSWRQARRHRLKPMPQPAQIVPGEVGMAFTYFETGKDLPDKGAAYEVTCLLGEVATLAVVPLRLASPTARGAVFGHQQDRQAVDPRIRPQQSGRSTFPADGQAVMSRTRRGRRRARCASRGPRARSVVG
jgi:hypothetical protein